MNSQETESPVSGRHCGNQYTSIELDLDEAMHQLPDLSPETVCHCLEGTSSTSGFRIYDSSSIPSR